MIRCSTCELSRNCGTTIISGACNIHDKELASAIANEIEKSHSEITPNGHNVLLKIAVDVSGGNLKFVTGETDSNMKKLTRYGNSYDISNNLSYSELAEAVMKAQRAIAPLQF